MNWTTHTNENKLAGKNYRDKKELDKLDEPERINWSEPKLEVTGSSWTHRMSWNVCVCASGHTG